MRPVNCYSMRSLLNNAIKIAINKPYLHDVKLKDELFRAVESALRGKDLPTGFGKSCTSVSNRARCIRLYYER
jgi:hypothetical protein